MPTGENGSLTPSGRDLPDSDIQDEFSELAGMLTLAQESGKQQRASERSPEGIAKRKRRRKRRLITTGVVLLLVAAVVGTYIPVVLLAPVGSATAATELPSVEVPAAVTVTLPEVGASAISVLGAEQFPGTEGTGGILAASGGNDPRPIASITKLITALVILDAKPIEASSDGPTVTVTFTEADADLYDVYYVKRASVWPLKAGKPMALREALRVMLVVSATNYADALTTWTFGSHSKFRTAARSWLDANGFGGTTLVEPTGLDPRNLSTPTDLIAIGRLAMANPVIADIVGPNHAGLPSTNALLGVDGINGIKTGTLDAAGACLLFSAVVDVGSGVQISVIGVVLGGDNRYQINNAVQELIASVKSGFHSVPVLVKGQKLGSYATAWGDEASVVAARDASIFTWSNMPVQSRVSVDDLSFGESGVLVGEATFVSGDAEVTVPLLLEGDITEPDGWWRLTHPGELSGR